MSEEQQDEMLALASIYGGSFECTPSEPGGCFRANIQLPEHLTVKFSSTEEKCIKYLPPITLHFELPAMYPVMEPPKFTLSCQWLSLKQLSELCRHMDFLYEENDGEVILFTWTSFLQDEALTFLNITSPLDLSRVIIRNSISEDSAVPDSRAMQDIAAQSLLSKVIVEHDRACLQQEFDNTLFTCEVCLSERLGSLCTSFVECKHVYCKACMQAYFEVQINDGNVKGLTCPANQCESQAHPDQVKQLVSGELFARYDRLLLQCSLDTMSDVVYCPRTVCATAVLIEQDSDGNTSGQGSCPACHFVFCIYCKQAYHGVAPCKIQADNLVKLRKEYLDADCAGKKILEKRFGKQTIKKLIEESFTQDWLNENSKKCPHCKTSIQKVDGCNKMTCSKCHAYFCWMCMANLSRANPYFHFNVPGTPCHNRLFHGMTNPDEEEWEEEEDEDLGEWEDHRDLLQAGIVIL